MNFDFILKHKKLILLIFSAFLLAEIFSFISFHFAELNIMFFALISLLTLILAFYRMEWAIYLVFSELLFNSMGNIFFLEEGGIKISLRISLWLIVLAIWLAKFIINLIRDKNKTLAVYKKIPYIKAWGVLALFIVLGFFYGLIKNEFSDAFFDFNSWLYFILIFPLWQVISEQKNEKFKEEEVNKKGVGLGFSQNIILIFLSATLFLVFKSLLLLFLFSHNLEPLIADLYYWTRAYYLGEITAMSGGFYRIFLQSQIFVVFAFLISTTFLAFTDKKSDKIKLLILNSFLASTIILSFSRSFWLGAIFALALLFIFLWHKYSFKKMFNIKILTLTSLILGFLIVLLIVRFPWPSSEVKFNLDSLSERAKVTASESALSSRWALLEVMKDDLGANFLLGRGFGARLEYVSSDPRVLERTADGVYSTYSFEWGWFDIWLKIGLFGLLAYLFLIFVFIKNLFKSYYTKNKVLHLGLILAIISLSVLNFFTPYLNHPLGIGFLLLIIIFLDYKLVDKLNLKAR